MNRSKVVVGLFAVLAAVSAIGFALLLSYYGSDPCLESGNKGGSCPTLALVDGVRYTVSIGRDLVGTEGALTPYMEITRTNAPEDFAERMTYQLAGVSPSAALVARNAPGPDEDAGAFRLLFALGPERDAAWPALCRYLTEEDRAANEQCE
jgi:hypothetical protein